MRNTEYKSYYTITVAQKVWEVFTIKIHLIVNTFAFIIHIHRKINIFATPQLFQYAEYVTTITCLPKIFFNTFLDSEIFLIDSIFLKSFVTNVLFL